MLRDCNENQYYPLKKMFVGGCSGPTNLAWKSFPDRMERCTSGHCNQRKATEIGLRRARNAASMRTVSKGPSVQGLNTELVVHSKDARKNETKREKTRQKEIKQDRTGQNGTKRDKTRKNETKIAECKIL